MSLCPSVKKEEGSFEKIPVIPSVRRMGTVLTEVPQGTVRLSEKRCFGGSPNLISRTIELVYNTIVLTLPVAKHLTDESVGPDLYPRKHPTLVYLDSEKDLRSCDKTPEILTNFRRPLLL